MKRMSTPELLSTNHSSPAGQSSCELQTLRWCGPGADGRYICKRGRRRLWAAGTARRRSWGAAACCCATCCCRECGAAHAPPAAWRTAAGRFAASPAGRPASLGPAPVMGESDGRKCGQRWMVVCKPRVQISLEDTGTSRLDTLKTSKLSPTANHMDFTCRNCANHVSHLFIMKLYILSVSVVPKMQVFLSS